MQTAQSSEEQMKLMKYLDDFDKQLSNRRSSASGLEEQLASLSRAYNQAQEKLLDTERALMAESVLLEKQRSVIDIYKCALNEELDEQGLLYFLQRLEEDEANREIYDDIAQVRNCVARRKTGSRRSEEERVKELKKQLARVSQDNSIIAEENEKVNMTCYEAQLQCQQLQEELDSARQEIARKNAELTKGNALLEEQRNTNQRLSQQVATNALTIHEFASREKELMGDRKRLEEMERVLGARLSWGQAKAKENTSCNLPEERGRSKPINRDGLEELEAKLTQLTKYKAQYKRLKEQNTCNDFLKKEIALLKLFLSEEALLLFRELELQKQECIESELRNLALLERSRLIKLQDCEKDIWKYRIQLMLEEEGEKPRPNQVKPSNLCRSDLCETSHPRTILQSVQLPAHVSEFSS